MELREEELIYDWNRISVDPLPTAPRLMDHTLACADRSPWVAPLDLDRRLQILDSLQSLGLEHVVLGPGDQPGMPTLLSHCQEIGLQAWVEETPVAGAQLHLSSQPGWTQRLAAAPNCSVVLVVPDCYQCSPTEMATLVGQLRDCPIEALCLSDNCGLATPAAAVGLVEFCAEAMVRAGRQLEIQWSGRNDRGLAVANALSAWSAGAQTLHGSFFFLGEGWD